MGVSSIEFRSLSGRVTEWRARRRKDPVERLQFLQGKTGGNARPRQRISRRAPAPAITLGLALAGAMMLRPWAIAPPVAARRLDAPVAPAAPPPAEVSNLPRVWLVETTGQSDVYSNGLRVENEFSAGTSPRRYLAFVRSRLDELAGEWRAEPAGIVFHTTESHLAPFEENQNPALRRAGEGLLEYVRRRRSYHFVIDRFGRVYRIAPESDYANHAGNSIWADDTWIYLNLNQSFLGVAFEARSSLDGLQLPVNPAQIHSGRILVEMLRARYSIPSGNCVTHAQVSVNPDNGRAGYHIDFAANLPFAELGLSDNYRTPLPGLALFGFEPDASLADAGNEQFRMALQSAARELELRAAARHVTVDRYRKELQKHYREAIAAQRARGLPEENSL